MWEYMSDDRMPAGGDHSKKVRYFSYIFLPSIVLLLASTCCCNTLSMALAVIVVALAAIFEGIGATNQSPAS